MIWNTDTDRKSVWPLYKSPLEVAELYASAKHEPLEPSTAEAYQLFWYETLGQYLDLVDSGWKFIPSEDNPYATFAQLCGDAKQGRLRVWTGGDLPENHPLAASAQSFKTLADKPRTQFQTVTRNWVFRCVHDIAGHYMSQSTFQTFAGECNAWKNHKRFYSRSAQTALFTETVAQLCWNYEIGKLERFAEQKACIL